MRSCCQTGTKKIPNFHVFQAVLINSTIQQPLISVSEMKMSPLQGRGWWQKLLKFLYHLQFLSSPSPPPRDRRWHWPSFWTGWPLPPRRSWLLHPGAKIPARLVEKRVNSSAAQLGLWWGLPHQREHGSARSHTATSGLPGIRNNKLLQTAGRDSFRGVMRSLAHMKDRRELDGWVRQSIVILLLL